MRSSLPCRILIGPLSPTLSTGGVLTSSSLTHDRCLGGYLHHPMLRPFYMHPTLLLPPEQPGPVMAPGTLAIGGAAGWSIHDLLGAAREFEPELLIWWGFHYALPADIAECPIPTLLIVSDWHYHYAAARQFIQAFDYVLCDRLLLQSLRAQGMSHCDYWPAYGFDPQMMYEHNVPTRDIDICFLGNTNPATYQARNRFLRLLAPLGLRYQVLIRNGIPHPDYARVLSRSKIVFNHALRREMNLRAYEATACGALLFQESDNLEVDDFLPGACVRYTEANLIDLMDNYLRDHDTRARIAGLGQQLIQNFTYHRQFESLLDHLPALLGPSPTRKHGSCFTPVQQARQLLTTDLPALRARALELLETDLAAPLNALAVCRSDYEALQQLGSANYVPHTQIEAVHAQLGAQLGDDPAALNNRAWLSFFAQNWQVLGQDCAQLALLLDAGQPMDSEQLVLPLRFTSLHSLRQMLLFRYESNPEALALEWQRLLRWSCHFLSGYAELAKQQLPRAASAFGAATRCAPELPEAWFELARCLESLQRLDEAIVALESGIERGVFFPGAWLNLIRLLRQSGFEQRARRRLIEAAVLFQDPNYAAVQRNIQMYLHS